MDNKTDERIQNIVSKLGWDSFSEQIPKENLLELEQYLEYNNINQLSSIFWSDNNLINYNIYSIFNKNGIEFPIDVIKMLIDNDIEMFPSLFWRLEKDDIPLSVLKKVSDHYSGDPELYYDDENEERSDILCTVVGSHSNATLEFITELYNSNNPSKLAGVAQNPNTPKEYLKKLAIDNSFVQHPDEIDLPSTVNEHVLCNPNLDEEVIKLVFEDFSFSYIQILLGEYVKINIDLKLIDLLLTITPEPCNEYEITVISKLHESKMDLLGI